MRSTSSPVLLSWAHHISRVGWGKTDQNFSFLNFLSQQKNLEKNFYMSFTSGTLDCKGGYTVKIEYSI